MIPNNNFSVLPWYTSVEQQNARRWWVYDRVYPLFSPSAVLLPWQLIASKNTYTPSAINGVSLIEAKTGAVIRDLTTHFRACVKKKSLADYDVWVYDGTSSLELGGALPNGQYYIVMRIGSVMTRYSEVFTVVDDLSPYLKIEWWDAEDFVMDEGTIVYTDPAFKNVLYLMADIAKPEYIFEEEGETRDGYFFPVKQISEKRYRFSFLASEYLLDVMRFIRMADYAKITYNGQEYSPDTFLITPDWENNGDVAAVEAEFDTATVAKKIGKGFAI